MQPRRKKLKKNQEKKEENDDLDGLSSLPDSLLCVIFSFLDTKSVVRTSILSKRYRLLWTLSQSLDFESSQFNDPHSSHVPTRISMSSRFCLFVCNVLQKREPSNLFSFRLSLHCEVNSEFIDSCIKYAAEHKVQYLNLQAYVGKNSGESPVALPNMLLTSSSLLTLQLHDATVNGIDLPKSVMLPNLKLMLLENFEFSRRNYNGELFKGCPNLETLVLAKCCIKRHDEVKCLDLNFLNLENLEIRCWRSPWICFGEHIINVDAPKLACFKLQGHLVRVNFKETLPCLEKAYFDLCYPTSCAMICSTRRIKKASQSFASILSHLSNAQFISLSLKTIEVMNAISDLRSNPPVIFDNLRFLKFTTEDKYKEKNIRSETLTRLLGRASNNDKEENNDKMLILDCSKELRLLPESSSIKKRKDIALRANVMHYILENSPSLENLCIEIPEVYSLKMIRSRFRMHKLSNDLSSSFRYHQINNGRRSEYEHLSDSYLEPDVNSLMLSFWNYMLNFV